MLPPFQHLQRTISKTERQYVPTSQKCDHDIQRTVAFSSYLSTNIYTYNFYNDIGIRTSAHGSQTPGCKPSTARGLIQRDETAAHLVRDTDRS